MAIRIVVADDADLLILGARAVLEQDHRYAVVGSARCMDDLLKVAQAQQPDVILLSEWIYSVDVLSAVEAIQAQLPQTKIIILGALADGLLIHDLFAAGVRAYLYKSDDLCDLLSTAVDTVMLNRPYLSPTASAEYLIAMQSSRRQHPLDAEARTVLNRLAQGDHIQQIALHLGVGVRRVYWVREKLRHRFNAKTNEHLIQRAAAEGFIYPRD